MSGTATEPGVTIADWLDQWIIKSAHGICWVYLLLIVAIMVQLVLRKGFANGMSAIEELQWHLYAIGVMFGIPYVQTLDAHVRVDILTAHIDSKTKKIIEIICLSLFIVPFILIIIYHGIDFVAAAWRVGEHSSAPAGLPWRWLIKSVIPLSFTLWLAAVISRIIRTAILVIKNT